MQYKIKSHTKEKVGNEVVRELLTLEVTYADESTSEHGFVVPEGANVKEFAVECAAQLEKALVEPMEVTTEEVEVKTKDKEVKKADVLAKIEEDEAVKAEGVAVESAPEEKAEESSEVTEN